MNTEFLILSKHMNANINQITLPDMNNEEKSAIEFFIEVTRHIMEINQLFSVYRFNLNSILHFYTLLNTDKVKRKETFDIEAHDFIAVNALTINLISSGKTLTEAIESFLKGNIEEDSELYKTYKTQCLNKKYDDCFSYRLLLRLRDFSQHGHIPVSIDPAGAFCFDLDQISLTPHFSHNKTLKPQMEKIIIEIHKIKSTYPRIAFTYTIAEFNMCVTEIYSEFIYTIENKIHDYVKNIKNLLSDRPELVYKSKDSLNGFVLYKIDDNNNLHIFNPQGDFLRVFDDFKEEADKILKEERVEWNILNASIKNV